MNSRDETFRIEDIAAAIRLVFNDSSSLPRNKKEFTYSFWEDPLYNNVQVTFRWDEPNNFLSIDEIKSRLDFYKRQTDMLTDKLFERIGEANVGRNPSK